MDATKEILASFDNWEILIIKATFLISFVLFCMLHIFKTVKDLKKRKRFKPVKDLNKRKRKGSRRRR
jgi:hypothetical protein